MKNKDRIKYYLKKLVKNIFILKENLKVRIRIYFFKFKNNQQIPKLYYGGSREGDKGGPLVKTKKLKKYYSEYNLSFNIIYLQSNTIYLYDSTIECLKKRNLPIVLNQNGVFYPAWFEGNWEKENLKISKAYHCADCVLWQSKFSKKASEKFLGKREGMGDILYNAIDTEIFIPYKRNLKKTFTFLITGNINKKSIYRISSVIDAFNDLLNENKNVSLKIAGNIEDASTIFKKIKILKLENNISFIKSYKQNDAPQIYGDADAYITMSYQDNCPSAVIEAMSCGLPILYSSSGGTPELVGKDSGIGLKVKESWQNIQVPLKSEIKDGMRKIINHSKEMSEAGRERAIKHFDIKNWIKKHDEIFQRFIKT